MFETLSGVNFIKNIFFEEENKNEKRMPLWYTQSNLSKGSITSASRRY